MTEDLLVKRKQLGRMVCRKSGGFCGRCPDLHFLGDGSRGVLPSFVDNVIRQYKGSQIESVMMMVVVVMMMMRMMITMMMTTTTR